MKTAELILLILMSMIAVLFAGCNSTREGSGA